jgi:glutathione S-transferase
MSKPKDTRLPEFLALNHRGKAPVFVDVLPETSTSETTAKESKQETVTINESLAILQYIETYYKPDCPLLPPYSERRLRAVALARIQESENLRMAYDALEHEHFEAEHSGSRLSDTERADLIEAVNKELDYWEAYAEKTSFIAGDNFGLADCALFPCLAYMVYRGFEWRRRQCNSSDTFEEVDAWPHLKAYFQRVWDRGGRDGCAQKAHPEGWHGKKKVNIWKGTRGNAKGLYAQKN